MKLSGVLAVVCVATCGLFTTLVAPGTTGAAFLGMAAPLIVGMGTILLVEQKLPFARRAAESFFIMERGRMVANGPMDELNDDLIQRYLTV